MNKDFNRHILLEKDEILLQHRGEVTKEVLLDTLNSIERVLDNYDISRVLRKRVVYLAIESLQNLQLHGGVYHVSDLEPEFILSKGKDTFNLMIGNLVLKEECKALNDRLVKINSLDKDELKYLFGVVIKQSGIRTSKKGGAGLGLIDMRKKSTRKLEFTFQEIDAEFNFFSLKVVLSQNL